MRKKLIELQDEMMVQVTIPEDEIQYVSKNSGEIEKVEAGFEKVKDLILKGCKPLTDTWALLNQDMKAESAEVEFGISFTGKGSVYLVESSAEASLKVKVTWKF